MRKFILFTVVTILFLISCNNDERLEKNLIGTWTSVSLQVTYENDSVYLISEDNWESILKMKPIRTTYYGDKRFISEYRDLNDSIVYSDLGKWSIKNDSLILDVNYNLTSFHFKYSNGIGEFKRMMDWNKDKTNELYLGIQRKEK